MKYQDFRSRSFFDHTEVLAFGHGLLLEDAPEGFGARLPIPPMLMVDQITLIESHGARGRIEADRKVRLDDWFFQCHFSGDPVQPGCLGVDAVWQLIGFYCAWIGGLGTGRALGCGEIDFSGQIRPHDEVVRYEIDIVRFSNLPKSGSCIAIGDARVLVDSDPIYSIQRAKVGLFRDITYPDYPHPSKKSRGGRMSS
ncbi:MAG: bifunctional 3-hydroxydecanoyl-ACP dehydratase/trans-2-decenoyl-ACP isomerase [Thermoanaerobaculales bacterium]|nr:bifunctional 3-hydroxydecanoyl-ACP dehydratase/trans-2-decenoyl-ACP isomerase [Thermoanaerobaculales bacterium]